jgi:hypothetical protein
LRQELEVETHRREAMADAELQAERVLARYREPLAAAAFDVQSRLYNLLAMDFLDKAEASIRWRTRPTTALSTGSANISVGARFSGETSSS